MARHWCLLLGFMVLSAAGVQAQLPQTRISSIFPPGGQQGMTVEVSVGGGTDLDELDQMVFDHPGITAVPKQDAAGNPVAGTFVVSIPADVPPGLYDARVRGLFGISNPRSFRVDSLPEIPEAEPNNNPEQATEIPVGTVVNARANGGTDVDYFRIPVKSGQTIVIRSEAARLDSPMQPLLQLTSSDGRRLADARRIFSQEAMIVWKATRDEALTLRVQDVVYGGGDQFVYRLAVDSRPLVDWVSPAFVVSGQSTPVSVFGRYLTDGQPTEHKLDGQTIYRKELLIPPVSASRSIGASATSGFAESFWWNEIPGNLVQLGISSALPISEAADAPEQSVSAPFEATGSFGARADEDVFRFSAKKGESWIIEMFAQRLGSLADPLLMVERAAIGGDGSVTWSRVGTEDDDKQNPGGADLPTLSDDPTFRLDVPEDGLYRIRVRDRYAATRGDPRLQYRISVRAPHPDFSLVVFDAFPSADGKAPATSGAASLRKGGSYELAVYAYRRDGHNDPIRIQAEQLPAGLTCRPSVIGPGQNTARLILTAAADAAEQISPIQVTGRSGDGDAAILRNARTATLIHDAVNGLPRAARLSASLVAGVMKDEQPFSLIVDLGSAELCQDQQLLIPVRIIRRQGFDGKVDLSFYNVPGETDAPNFAIEPGQDSAVARLYFKENAPVSASTLLIQGTSAVPYRRNPWQAERARTKVTEAEAAVAARQAEATASETAFTAAQQVVTALGEKAKQLSETLAGYAAEEQKLRERIAAAAAEQTAALDAVVKTQAALAGVNAAAATPEELRAAVAAEAEATAAAEAAVTALESLTSAGLELAKQTAELRREQVKTAELMAAAEAEVPVRMKEVEAAQAALTEARKAVESATAAKTASDEALKKAEEASKPNNVNVRTISDPLVVRIHRSPAKLAAALPDSGMLKRGASATVKVTITRRNGFAGPLKLTLALPSGVAGITAAPVDVPADKNEGELVLTAAADAPAGDIANAVIQAAAEFDGRTAVTDVPVAIKVVE